MEGKDSICSNKNYIFIHGSKVLHITSDASIIFSIAKREYYMIFPIVIPSLQDVCIWHRSRFYHYGI